MGPRIPNPIKSGGIVDAERQRVALHLLREAGAEGLTREGLRTAMGDVSLRTVDRALKMMEAQGAQFDRVRRGWPSVIHIRVTCGPTWDDHVSSATRLALRLAGLSLAQCGTLLWQDKLDVLERLASEHMSSRDRKLFDNLKKAVSIQGGVEDPIEAPDILEPILQALEGPREMAVEYQAVAAKEPRVLTVVPYTLTHDLFSGGTFLLVWDPGRQCPLHLRLSRIVGVKVTGRIGSCPREPMERAARYQIGGWTSGEPPFRVEARIRGAHWVQAFKEAPPALPEFEGDPSPDGASVRVRFLANHGNGALRWLLQFGAAAEVLEPDHLRAKAAEQAREALAQYEAHASSQG